MSKKNLTKFLVFVLTSLFLCLKVSAQYGPFDVETSSGKYDFSYNEIPGNLVPSNAGNTGTSYSWEMSTTPLFDGTVTTVATTASYNVTSSLSQTTYYRRKTTITGGAVITSNVIELKLVSENWEDINYVREHDILLSGVTDWEGVDQLPIGSKLQTTTYLDGLGRPIEKVSRATAAPQDGGGQWGDQVQFSVYDSYGRQNKNYLPYTTTTDNPGKFKSDPITAESSYYGNPNTYNETSSYSSVTFDNSPLNRVTNIKSPGTSWAAGLGNSADYSLNDASDDVQQFRIDYTTGSLPVLVGAYDANTLLKTTHTDENGKKVIDFTNSLGQLILSKTEALDTLTDAYDGWICTYSVYDDFGMLRFRMQPDAVKWLAAHSWSFAGTDGPTVADNLCFRYEYDDKGRNIVKKAPGAKELNMLYDSRDRVVFMQDGNQAAKTPPEWTANLYDDLDRITVTTLYHTGETRAALQADIDNSATVSTVTLDNPDQPVTDLVVDDRQYSQPPYKAQNSIEFDPGFESATNDNFTAEIDPTTVLPVTITTTTLNNPISQANLNDASVCTPVKYNFYDNYSFTAVKGFDNNFNNTSAYPNGGEVIAIAPTTRTLGFPTGSLVRVLGTNTFLASTVYYDEKGRQIQTLEDNIKSGKDVTTLQYQWDGRLLSTDTKHTTAGTGYNSFDILTKNMFDKIGRVISIEKKYGDNGFKTVASYDLDDMGRLKTKHLDPDYSPPGGGTGLESLNYTYNIHNNITGINKDYALKGSSYDKWGHYFGMYLGYDNRDGVFNVGKLDGHVTGIMWNTQGDDNQRKYDYTYDDAGRLTRADFLEKATPADSWSNAKVDLSVSGNSPTGGIVYDYNGNLISMIQKGVVIGNSAPLTVDDLTYAYTALSNKLVRVTDNGTLGSTNGMLGDFKNGTNGGDDYAYDDNGNLIIDLNKNATGVTGGVTTSIGTSGITYNFLDKPELIHISGKGTIQIIYDADGNKLERKYTPDGGTTKTTTYINQFVYQDDKLQYINFEEGRIRVMTPVSTNNGYDGLAIDGNMNLPNGNKGAYDYFIRDYQQNVRMILTEETHYGINECTMENDRSAVEEPIFGSPNNNEVSATRVAISTIPGQGSGRGWASNTSSEVSKLSKLSGHTIGPNSLLKVMAGDVINAKADYYYPAAVTNNTNSLVSDIVAAFVNSVSGSPVTPSLVHGNTTDISNTLLNATPPFAGITDPDQGTGDQIPRAYLTVAFFNERFEFVSEGSIAVRVSQAGDGAPSLVLSNIKSPKNGYAYIYLSNENDDPVYFDNFTVSDTRGRIIEEDHYYPFGLKIAGISSTKLGDPNEGSLKNNNLYNDKELFDDADLDWYDYGFRNYDPQIGRFPQLDPLTDQFPGLTNYQYASNDPIANVDIDGLEGTSSIGDFTYNLASKSNLVLGHMPQVSAALTKTVSHILPIAIQAIHLAVNVVQRQINNKNLNKIASDELSKSVMDYYLAHKHEMSFTDLLALNALANNYYKGLNCMAWWAKGDFLKLNREVINSTLPDALKVARVELGIEDSQEGWRSFFHSGAKVGIFISSLGLFPDVGMGPSESYFLKFGAQENQGEYILNSSWKNWNNYLNKRGWTFGDIRQTLLKGKWEPHSGTNYLNPGNPMSIVTNSTTGKSLIIDNVTKEIIQLGDKGFKY